MAMCLGSRSLKCFLTIDGASKCTLYESRSLCSFLSMPPLSFLSCSLCRYVVAYDSSKRSPPQDQSTSLPPSMSSLVELWTSNPPCHRLPPPKATWISGVDTRALVSSCSQFRLASSWMKCVICGRETSLFISIYILVVFCYSLLSRAIQEGKSEV